MAVELIHASDYTMNDYVNMLCLSKSGSGKTTLCATLGHAFIISIEGGMLSIRGCGCDIVEARSMKEVNDAYDYFLQHKDEYTALCIDSITELSELKLLESTKKFGKSFDRFSEMGEKVKEFIRKAKDGPFNLYVTALVDRDKGQDRGDGTWLPKTAGKMLPQWLVSQFDEVFTITDCEDKDKNPIRMLQTSGLRDWELKDRSGVLDMFEPFDLEAMVTKILGHPITGGTETAPEENETEEEENGR